MMTEQSSLEVAKILVDSTNDVVLSYLSDWLRNEHEVTNITVLTGSGKSTYFSFPKNKVDRKDKLSLRYGKLMVLSTYDSNQACRWLHAREIQQFGYYGGQITIPNLLAAVVLHEVSHLVQMLLENDADEGVHNRKFYRILGRAHGNPVANELRDHITKRMQLANLPLVFNDGSEVARGKCKTIRVRN